MTELLTRIAFWLTGQRYTKPRSTANKLGPFDGDKAVFVCTTNTDGTSTFFFRDDNRQEVEVTVPTSFAERIGFGCSPGVRSEFL